MSDAPELEVAATEAVAKAEAAATRRRWINLGEFVAVAGLIIAAVSLWMTWHDRKADEADKQAEKTAAAQSEARYAVRSSLHGKDIVITADDRHTLGDISVTFPSDLGVAPQTSATQTIPAGWYEKALLKATDGGADSQTGKLPVLLTVHYMDDDTPLSTTGVFDIVWRTNGRVPPLGRDLHILGMRLHERGGSQARIDALWKAGWPAS
ncbi:MAG: hypothetical protein E7773_06335 [Sphingomonas sp.]|uniref:hypothetical protein n=1 Tax=Sphingomonas sp. TaxID=28214 RepID=UPI0011FA462B|nr:hypothetical protein [Sphingomonas sp.]THD36624.1 MAG: hypothetical protein E7773_06335 [Sphingomonas sp.]